MFFFDCSLYFLERVEFRCQFVVFDYCSRHENKPKIVLVHGKAKSTKAWATEERNYCALPWRLPASADRP
jgi:hypothetical protein